MPHAGGRGDAPESQGTCRSFAGGRGPRTVLDAPPALGDNRGHRFDAVRTKGDAMSTIKPGAEGVALLGKAPQGPVDLAEFTVLLHPEDHVAIAKQTLLPRTVLRTGEGQITVATVIPFGHKVALKPIATGE